MTSRSLAVDRRGRFVRAAALAAAVAGALPVRTALAHEGTAITAWLYARGVRALWRRAGVGQGVRRWQAAAFAGGIAALTLALISPLDRLSAALFSAHMVQHLALILVAAPLLVLGAPLLPSLWALPPARRRALGRWWKRARAVRFLWHAATVPVVAWLLHAVAVWIWHLPALYQSALRSTLVHQLEHISFLGTALLFWWVLIHPAGRRGLGYGWGVLYVFAAALQSGALGIALTFAPSPWYPAYAATTGAWGLTPLEDQQLAGLIMWIPAGMLYLLAGLVLLAAWARQAEREAQRWEQAATPQRIA
jgi:putative membrane protein